MKLTVIMTIEHIYETEIEVDSLDEAREVIRKLTMDEYSELDEFHHHEVKDENGQDVTGEVQP
jgi:hypothetical protein